MNSAKNVFIVGWYGTETTGDKAILGGILNYYRQCDPSTRFSIASLHPYITRQTLRELNVDAQITATHSWHFVRASATADEVVMGGGPLMDMESLSIPLWAFLIARLFRRRRVIFGCGMGPLKQKKYIDAVRQILLLATTIKLRDSDSVAWATRLTGRRDIEQIADPATGYVQWLSSQQVASDPRQSRELACFLRDWPREYTESDQEYQQVKRAFETHLAEWLQEICQEYQLYPAFYAMHTFTVGDDDRDFNRRFIASLPAEIGARYNPDPSSVNSILQAMQTARLCVCMRFHSVVFARTLNRPFVAIDYTNGGKILGLLKDQGCQDRAVALHELAEGLIEPLKDAAKAQLS